MVSNVIIDGYYNVVSAMPEFFTFIGDKKLKSFLKNICEDDRVNVRKYFECLSTEKLSYIVARLKDSFDVYWWVFLESKVIVEGDNDKKRIYTDIYTIDNLRNVISEQKIEIKKQRTLLSLINEIYFEYSMKTECIRIYWINKNQDIEIYNDKFSNWKEYMFSNHYIKDKNLASFEKLCRDIEGGARNFYYEINNSKIYADNEKVYNVFKGQTLYLDNEPICVVGVLTASSEEAKNNIVQTGRDALTGLLNRESIIRYTTDVLAKKPDFSVHIVMIDLDNFKFINSNFGYLFGDEIMKEVADTLDEIVRYRGVVGRFHGDSFTIVFSGFNDNMELRSYLKAIRMTIERKFKNIKDKFNLTVSMGSVKYPESGQTVDELIKISNICLKIAKAKGKNRYVIYDENIDFGNYEKKKQMNVLSIESREKNTEFSCSILQTLLKRKKEGIYDALESIGSLRKLSRIVIFWGEELKRLYFWGEIANLYDNAKYIYKSDYLKNFNINGVFVVHSSTGIELKNPDVHSDFSRQLIYSTIQCLIYDDDKNVTGMISFEKNFQRKGWTDDEIYDYTLFTKLIGEVLKNTI